METTCSRLWDALILLYGEAGGKGMSPGWISGRNGWGGISAAPIGYDRKLLFARCGGCGRPAGDVGGGRDRAGAGVGEGDVIGFESAAHGLVKEHIGFGEVGLGADFVARGGGQFLHSECNVEGSG